MRGEGEESRNRKRVLGQRQEKKKIMAKLCVQTGRKKNPDTAQWQDFGCQNSSGTSTIVKLSAFEKMDEITYSLCLWEETVIAVDV